MKKKLALILPALLILGLEYFLCWNDLKAISPFPLAECWYRTLNHFLRDFLLLGTGSLLYLKKHRIKDRARRYFPRRGHWRAVSFGRPLHGDLC